MRAKYEGAILANQKKAQAYKFQYEVNKISESCLEIFKAYLGMFYTRNVNDLLEIETLIDEEIDLMERKHLLKKTLMNP